MPSKDNQEPSPSELNSAEVAPPAWLLGASESVEYTQTKCAKCDAPTMHQWTKIVPFAVDPSEDEFEVLVKQNQMSKRLTLCTQCGNLRLIT